MTTNTTEMNFSENLAYWLKVRGVSQQALADYLDVSTQTITNYVKGYNSPRMGKVDDICKFLGIKRSDLLDRRDDDSSEIYRDADFVVLSSTRTLKQGAKAFISAQLKSLTEPIAPTRQDMILWLNDNIRMAALGGRSYEDLSDDELKEFYTTIRGKQ